MAKHKFGQLLYSFNDFDGKRDAQFFNKSVFTVFFAKENCWVDLNFCLNHYFVGVFIFVPYWRRMIEIFWARFLFFLFCSRFGIKNAQDYGLQYKGNWIVLSCFRFFSCSLLLRRGCLFSFYYIGSIFSGFTIGQAPIWSFDVLSKCKRIQCEQWQQLFQINTLRLATSLRQRIKIFEFYFKPSPFFIWFQIIKKKAKMQDQQILNSNSLKCLKTNSKNKVQFGQDWYFEWIEWTM